MPRPVELRLAQDYEGIALNGERRRCFNRCLRLIVEGRLRFEEAPACLCGSKDHLVVNDKDRFGFPVSSLLCQACGLIRLSPKLKAEDLPLFYEEVYWGLVTGSSEESAVLDTGGEGFARELHRALAPFLPASGRLKIAEIGCGNGIKLSSLKSLLREHGVEAALFGCDYSSNAVAQCRKKGIRAVQADLAALSAEAPYDAVIMSHVLEHFHDPLAELARIRKLLAPQGRLYIEVPGVCDLENRPDYDFDYNAYSVIAHNFNFNLLSLKNVLRQAGFACLAGDEFVRAVFAPGDGGPISDRELSGNHQEIIASLNRAEAKRIARRSRPAARLKRAVRALLRIP
ncbi:MAG: class I SAM-dependent methyltransferase [Elusimicrobia bacterium]|nr:class I SAM-dependent methyltransferase [Elusimicrobiota bacterium]